MEKNKEPVEGVKKQSKVKKSEVKSLTGKVAVIRLRGLSGVRHDIKKTMEMLRLYKKNYCVVLDNSVSTQGMLKKIKDFVTYGEVDDKTFKLLVEKRGEEYKGSVESYKSKIKYNKFIVVDGKKYKPFFRLSPPRGGFERKGLKASFVRGGALGYRKDKMSKLIQRMI